MEQIKRANKLFSNDCIFLRHSLNIPVHTERPSLFNGLSLESPDGEDSAAQESSRVSYVPSPLPPPQAPPESTPRPPQPDELSAKDYLHMLDLQITRSKQAARKLKEDETSAVLLCVVVYSAVLLLLCCCCCVVFVLLWRMKIRHTRHHRIKRYNTCLFTLTTAEMMV
ncbi:hypothetical protein QTP86_033973 [Hemibagrus guttatus]|nr:hypothetical protein QTP86_033973 [Hemibagrus guttatus]